MQILRAGFVVCCCLLHASTVLGQTPTPYVIEPSILASTQPGVDESTATLTSIAAGGELIARTLGATYPNTFNLKDRNNYVLVHVVRWSDPAVPPAGITKSELDARVRAATAAKADVEAAKSRLATSANDDTRKALSEALASYNEALSQLATTTGSLADTDAPKQTVEHANWYVYNGNQRWTLDDFTKNRRTFGVSRLWFMYVHVNLFAPNGAARLRTYHPAYIVTVAPKIETPLKHFAILASLFPNLASLAPGGRSSIAVWGGRELSVHDPSDITIVPTLKADDPANPTKEPLPLGDEVKIDNEGRYRFDFSIAVPIRSVKDLSKNEEINALAPKVITSANAFAAIDVFFKKVDLKDPGFRRLPHLVAGVSLSDTDHPFRTFFVGGGWGPAIADFYAGWLRLRLASDSSGKKYQNAITAGVELPLVNGVLKRLK